MFSLKTKHLGHFDVAVAGAGVAGVCAAISAARGGSKVVLIERGGCLGGTLTEGFMPNIMDAANKGGIVKDEGARQRALDSVIEFGKNLGFKFIKSMTSPIKGGDGNVEYLVYFKKGNTQR